jgi:hypothetical protein
MSGRKKRVCATPETVRFFDKLGLDDPRSDGELDKARKILTRALAIEGGYVRPPWMDGPKDSDGPQVRAAKALLKIRFPQGEWRTMKLKAVHLAIDDEASERPISRDSVARAMGLRKRR